MKWLIWKEYRLNRLILIVGLVLLFGPHAIAAFTNWRVVQPFSNREGPLWAYDLIAFAPASLMISQLTLAVLGGYAIACERADRSAEFLAYLPISRARILAAKLVLPTFCVAVIGAVHLSILQLAIAVLPLRDAVQIGEYFWLTIGFETLTGLVFFSVGWLLSSILESPTFSICVGLITPLLIVLAGVPLHEMGVLPKPELWYLFTCLALAPACFIAGTCYYLRRVEP